ncbi:MAG: NAD-dependent epimerase/dehydratase family protein, partial [Bacteriovorax sp.]
MNFYPQQILDQYKGRNILVTGASGYIGSHLIEALKKADAQITCLSRKKTKDSEVEWGDTQGLKAILKETDIVFHLAAQTSAYKSEEDPHADFSSNIGNLDLLLSHVHLNKNRPALVMASTVTVYGLTPPLPTKEDYEASPTTIYDVDKLTAETLLENF